MTGSAPRQDPPSCDKPAAIVAAGPAACAAWEDFAAGGSLRRGTRANYRTAALRFLRWSEQRGIGLREVTPEAVSEFFAQLAVGEPTAAVYKSALRRFFDALASRGVIPANPAPTPEKRRAAARPAPAAPETRPAEVCLDELKATVRAVDPTLEEGSDLFDAGVVLLAGAALGTRYVMPISRFTGVGPRRVAVFARRLRANGVWTADGKTACRWGEEAGGDVAFIIDVLIASGLVEQRDDATLWPAPAGEPARPPGE